MKTVLLESLGISEEKLLALEAPLLAKGMSFVSYPRTNDKDILKEELKDADIAIVANMPLPDEVIHVCSSLRYIDVAFTGVDHIGLDAAKQQKIVVSNASGYSNEAVAELAIGAVLEHYRYLPQVEANCRQGRSKENYVGSEIKGKTVGIVGLGKIGMRSAELFHAFGATILANKKHFSEVPSWITLTSLDEILQKSDIVILHCPLNDETRGLIDAAKLSMMKSTSILLNLARGPIVNAKDLAQALEKGTIGMAMSDVFDTEPPLAKDEPLLKAPHMIVTPHIGFVTKEAMESRAQIVFDNLKFYLEGTPTNRVI